MGLNEYLNKAKIELNTEYDSVLARRLHMTTAGICSMRKSGSISDDTADYLGKILKVEPALIMLEARASKSHNKRFIASVRRILLQASTATAGLLIAIEEGANAVVCILC